MFRYKAALLHRRRHRIKNRCGENGDGCGASRRRCPTVYLPFACVFGPPSAEACENELVKSLQIFSTAGSPINVMQPGGINGKTKANVFGFFISYKDACGVCWSIACLYFSI